MAFDMELRLPVPYGPSHCLVCQLEGRPPFSNTSGMHFAISSPLARLGWIRGLYEVFSTG